MALINCKKCGQMISDKAEKCPNCGETISNTFSFNTKIILICFWVMFILSIIIFYGGSSMPTSNDLFWWRESFVEYYSPVIICIVIGVFFMCTLSMFYTKIRTKQLQKNIVGCIFALIICGTTVFSMSMVYDNLERKADDKISQRFSTISNVKDNIGGTYWEGSGYDGEDKLCIKFSENGHQAKLKLGKLVSNYVDCDFSTFDNEGNEYIVLELYPYGSFCFELVHRSTHINYEYFFVRDGKRTSLTEYVKINNKVYAEVYNGILKELISHDFEL